MRILHAKAIFLIDKRQKSAEFRHILTPFAYGLYTILFYLYRVNKKFKKRYPQKII